MSFGFGFGFPKNYVAATFDPRTLFGSGEQGAWYDPSDLTTLYQDAAGTTPVTAVEQPVGLMLDKSKGLVLGPELVTNGGFDADVSGWTANAAGALTWQSGEARIANSTGAAPGEAYQAVTLSAGKTYFFSVNITTISTVNAQFVLSATSSYLSGILAGSASNSTTGTKSFFYTPSTTGTYYLCIAHRGDNSVGNYAQFDNISVRELPGNHAYQSTSASRPVLSARVNMLTYTEQFDNAAWGKNNTTVSTNTTVAPNGTTTADTLVEAAITGEHTTATFAVAVTASVSYKASIRVKPAGRDYVNLRANDNNSNANAASILVNIATGQITGAATAYGTFTNASGSVSALGNGWYEITLVFTPSVSTIAFKCEISTGAERTADGRASAYAGDALKGIYLWGADLRPTNSGVGLPAYQRVGASTDYDVAGFPTFLRFDGVDDSLVTNNIDFTSTDKMTVFAGVRKLSDAASGTLAELGTGAQNGSFQVAAPTGGVTNYLSFMRGTANSFASSSSFAAPITTIIAAIGDIAADGNILRANGTQVASSTADQGTGNYGNYHLYIGARAGTSLWFSGRLYQLVARGAQSTEQQIIDAERYINDKTRAY